MAVESSDLNTTNKSSNLFVTSKEAASLLGVTLRTVQLWANNGILQCWKTDGRHRRIFMESVNQLLEARALQSDISGTTQQSESMPLKVLVVEDDINLLRLYRMQLARWPIQPEVSYASNGYQGLVTLGCMRPHLMITDLKMPNLNGIQMLNVLRGMPELDATEIVVVTGLSKQQLEAQGKLPTGIVVLPKPIPFAELEAIAMRIAEQIDCRC